MGNAGLNAAKAAKKDEFYTEFEDIEAEMNNYFEWNQDVFRDKTILLPCDDPDSSNFTKYFAANFERFGLKKLISTSYVRDAAETGRRGKLYIVEKDVDGNGRIDINDLEVRQLQGDGDFRSEEVTRLRDQADFVITNPPFSLFREFLLWIREAKKEAKFILIGHQNALTYREVFPLLKEDKMWLGGGFKGGVAWFKSPYEDTATASGHKKGMIRVSGVCWYTDVDHWRRHRSLEFDTMKNNLKHNHRLQKKLQEYGVTEYPKYDNFDAIEVPFTDAIPKDWAGAMGVPITFLDKYNPDQFEILGSDTDLAEPIQLEDGKTGSGRFYVNGRRLYSRILIRNLHPEPQNAPDLPDAGAEEEEEEDEGFRPGM